MEILIIIAWYLIGVIGGLMTIHGINKEIVVVDMIFCLTLFGAGGLITFLLGLPHMDFGNWSRKKLF